MSAEKPKAKFARTDELLAQSQWLSRLARGLLNGDADDAVQDTWIQALRHPPRDEVRPWLRQVLKNSARMRVRSEARRVRREAEVGIDLEAPTDDDPERLLERAELTRLLMREIAALEEPYRTTLELRYFEGLTSEEIALKHGVPPGKRSINFARRSTRGVAAIAGSSRSFHFCSRPNRHWERGHWRRRRAWPPLRCGSSQSHRRPSQPHRERPRSPRSCTHSRPHRRCGFLPNPSQPRQPPIRTRRKSPASSAPAPLATACALI
jgi:RNA polymerase sigma factor (sigma-70 family)